MSAGKGGSWQERTDELATELEKVATQLRSTNTIHDPITGLFSYEYLQARLVEEISRAERLGEQFALVALSFTARSGSSAGTLDQLTAIAAQILAHNVRIMDVVARINRLEFMLLIPVAGMAQAGLVVARLTTLASQAVTEAGGLRLMAGIAVYPEDAVDAEGMAAAARLALVKARSGGPGRSALAQGDEPVRSVLVQGNGPVVKQATMAVAREPVPAAIGSSTMSEVESAPAVPPVAVGPATMSEVESAPAVPATTPIVPPETEPQRLVAVGYTPGAAFPASYWEGNEMIPIEAILEERQGKDETCLLVQTAAGLVYLVQRQRRWYVIPG